MARSFGLTALTVLVLAIGAAAAQAQSPTPNDPRSAVNTQSLPRPTATPAKCLRALDGSCAQPALVEAARQRAIIVSSVRVSYHGTPAGSIGGSEIPFERLFREDPFRFGLPINVFVQACCITRSR